MNEELEKSGASASKLGAGLIVGSHVSVYLLLKFQIYIGVAPFIFIAEFWKVGYVMIFAALIKQQYRARWLFAFLFVYAAYLLGDFPIGTVLGGFAYVYLLKNLRSFFRRRSDG